ncbi:hypothetical protein [Streptomyces sp. RerS4]|uniref:hypothetical protein n=1 Tax=Streptomyces sp. RerS4 TaxID=2942449 RepID=UPI00201C5130|nr:hypothetical protein [Streptomyces sp. RerS4]UQX02693.1 hypothetical protein M4D82_21025 [Streptomyces sp. RerS4]
MIFLLVLGALLLAAALYVARGFYLIAKAQRLTARTAAYEAEAAHLNAEAAQLNAETAELEARTAARQEEAKATKAAAAVALGFVPEHELDATRPGPLSTERREVLDAVHTGDWETGAAYIEAAGKDWEERWQRVVALADFAADEDGNDAWLHAWRAARPTDPTAAVVNAHFAVQTAWNARGAKRARYTTQEQFRQFHQLIADAQRATHVAQGLADPADPLPYVAEQAIGMGMGYSHERYGALWQEITARAPKLLFAHTNALQYWCQKWRGSHEEALAFARASAAAGAPGELMTLLPLIAYFEQESHEDDIVIETWYRRPEVVAATDAALQDLADADPDHPGVVWIRHMLAYFLFWQDRDAQAVEQFRHIDGYIGSMPWTYHGEPRKRYTYARDWAVDVAVPGA